MTVLLKIFSVLADVVPADLSEAELLARYPALAAGFVVLLLVGVLCDGFVMFWLVRRSHAASDQTTPLLRVTAKPWDFRDLAMVISSLILVQLFGSGCFFMVAHLAHLNEDNTTLVVITGELIMRVVTLIALAVYFHFRQFDWRQVFGLNTVSQLGAMAQGAVTYFAILPPLAVVSAAYLIICRVIGIKESSQPVAEMFLVTDSSILITLLTGFAVIVAPVFEEVFFRGFAYPALKQRWGTWPAMLATSAVFAVVHMHVPSIAPLFALSLGLIMAYELTGSLLASITMHAMFNAANVAMLLYVRSQS